MNTSGREEVTGAKRIVVKVGSSSLSSAAGGLDGSRVDALVDALVEASPATGTVLVSSGAIAAGLAPLGLAKRPKDLATQQAAASVGQGLLIARYTQSFARHGRRVGQVLLTADDVTRRSHYRNAQHTFNRLLELGVVAVVNETDTVATIPAPALSHIHMDPEHPVPGVSDHTMLRELPDAVLRPVSVRAG